MTNSFETTLRYLYDLQFFGMKLGLENISVLLKSLNNPERSYPTIHIAGTNGKGSTSAMLESIFRAAGYRTGLYTSPHLFHFGERIRVEGRVIPEKDIVRLTQKMKPQIDDLKCTFFEATTAMAFEYFREQKIDIGIIETGLGGRLDATNVLTPLVSIITNIGLEHTEYLGNTIPAIAYEKAGIIKPQVPCVIGPVTADAKEVFDRMARERKSPIYFLDAISRATPVELLIDGSIMDLELKWDDRSLRLNKLKIALAGSHQLSNASLAAAAAVIQKHFGISEFQVRQGMAEVRWPARLEILRREPFILCDAAHNPDGLRTLMTFVSEVCKPRFDKIYLVIGMLSDKNYREAAQIVSPHFDRIFTVTPNSERALKADELADVFMEFHAQAEAVVSVGQAVENTATKMSSRDLMVVTGSHFVLSELQNVRSIS